MSKVLGHSSAAITADVYRIVKWDEVRAEHQESGALAESQA